MLHRKDDENMLKTCPVCGKMHGFGNVCPIKIERNKRRQALYDRSKYERNSKADKFRNTKQWQRKRNEIKDRDLNICRYCFLCRHKITSDSISVHHIIPLEKNFRLRLSDSNLISLCRICHEQAEKGIISAENLKNIIKKPMKLT